MRALITTVPVVLGFVLAGCGGDGGGGGGGLSKAEYVERANAICTAAKAELGKLAQPTTRQAADDFIVESKAISEKAVMRLRALEPPTEIAADVSRHNDLLDRQLAKVDELLAALRAGDRQRYAAVDGEIATLTRQGDDLAAKIGIDACGR